jgi:hypothetical protein
MALGPMVLAVFLQISGKFFKTREYEFCQGQIPRMTSRKKSCFCRIPYLTFFAGRGFRPLPYLQARLLR